MWCIIRAGVSVALAPRVLANAPPLQLPAAQTINHAAGKQGDVAHNKQLLRAALNGCH